jgi:hypothetical protein
VARKWHHQRRNIRHWLPYAPRQSHSPATAACRRTQEYDGTPTALCKRISGKGRAWFHLSLPKQSMFRSSRGGCQHHAASREPGHIPPQRADLVEQVGPLPENGRFPWGTHFQSRSPAADEAIACPSRRHPRDTDSMDRRVGFRASRDDVLKHAVKHLP